jgi:hypothetical protein
MSIHENDVPKTARAIGDLSQPKRATRFCDWRNSMRNEKANVADAAAKTGMSNKDLMKQ